MRKILIIVALLAGCTDNKSVENISRGLNSDITAYDMRGGVRCYIYISFGISCVKL